MSAFIYNMILGNFSMFFSESESDYIKSPPLKVITHLMHYLQKFPFSVKQKPYNFKLMDMCLFNSGFVTDLQANGINFVRQLIRTEEHMDEET